MKIQIEDIEENKTLGFASKKRLNVLERDTLIDFTQRLENSINYINENNEIKEN